MLAYLQKHCTKITLGFFLAWALWQNTADGLWFWCALAYIIARRWRVVGEKGGHFIRGIKKGQSVWNYGIYNAVVSFINPDMMATMVQGRDILTTEIYAPEISRCWAKTWFFGMFVLHMYVIAIIGLKYVLPEQLNAYLHISTTPLMPVLDKWYSFHWIVEKLTNRGYPDRALIVAHVYVVMLVAWLCSTIYWYYHAFYYTVRLKKGWQFYDRFKAYTDRFAKWRFLRGNTILILYTLFFIALCVGLAFFCWFVLSPLTAFPDEIAADVVKRVKWPFLTSYVYKSDMGLFTPAYFAYTFLMFLSLQLLSVVFIIVALMLRLVKTCLSLDRS